MYRLSLGGYGGGDLFVWRRLSLGGFDSDLLFLLSPELSPAGLSALRVSSALIYFSALSRSSVIMAGGFLDSEVLKL